MLLAGVCCTQGRFRCELTELSTDLNNSISRARASDRLSYIGENESVIEVTEPQVWTIIGVMVAALGAILTIVTQSFNRTIQALGDRMDAKFEAMGARFEGKFEGIDGKFESIDARFESIDAKFDAIDTKFDAIDTRFDGLQREMVLRFDHVDQRLDRLETRVDGLDRDMQTVMKRVFRDE